MLDMIMSLGEETLAYAVIVLVLGVVGQLFINGRKQKSDRDIAQLNADEALKRHTNEISIQLLDQLRQELTRLAEENARLTPYVERARVLARHLDSILHAEDSETRNTAEETARGYLEGLGEI